jgi:hypothetical protein
MVEDLADYFGVDNESENFHPGPAAGAIEGVDLVDPVDELGPSSAQGTPGCRLTGFTVRLEPGEVVGPEGVPNAVGVDAVEEDEVFFGLGDVDEDAGQELERVDESLVVLDGLPALGLIEQEL